MEMTTANNLFIQLTGALIQERLMHLFVEVI